jgi:hypothetical protein
MTIKAIETRYAGRLFRSRLEARCAVFLTALGCKWEYEPEGFELPSGYYLPDFKVYDDKNYAGYFWIECKPVQPQYTEDDLSKEVRLARELSGGTKAGVLLFSGDSFDAIRQLYFEEKKDDEWLQVYEGCGKWRYLTYEDAPIAFCWPKSISWQVWDRHSIIDTEFFFPMKTRGMNVLDATRPSWPLGKAFKAANAALSARFEHGETPQ